MTTERQLAAQRFCQAWTDHVWITGRLIDTGCSPASGHYRRVEARCTRCGKSVVETQWITKPAPLNPRVGD